MGNEVIKAAGSVLCSSVTGAVVGGLVYGSIGALTGAISGPTGAAIMQAANHTGYDVTEAAQIGAIGGGVLNASLGVLAGGLSGALRSCGFFKTDDSTKTSATTSGLLSYTIGSVAGGLVGYGILNSTEQHTIMQLQETAIAFAVGSVTTCIPLTLAVICIALPIAIACMYRSQEELDAITLSHHKEDYGSFKLHSTFYSNGHDMKPFW